MKSPDPSEPSETPPVYEWLAAAPVLLAGLYLVLLSRGVLPNPPFATGRHAIYSDARHGSITAFGSMFLLAGVLLCIPPRFDRWRRWLGRAIGGAFLLGCLGVLVDLNRR